jgi:small subunit ribosomal protein S3
MGQKISTKLFRSFQTLSQVEISGADPTTLQKSVWFATGRNYSKILFQDSAIREFVKKEIKAAGLVEVIIRRYFRRVEIYLYVTKPGVVIGKAGATINALRQNLVTKFNLPKDLKVSIEEFKDPFRSSQVIASEIAMALEKNIPYRRLIKTMLEKIKYSGIQGAKITVKGRLNKAEIARKEELAFGSIPRHTISSIIDTANVDAKTAAGIIGVKVMLYKGNKLTNYTY